jgi:hypothetical protein
MHRSDDDYSAITGQPHNYATQATGGFYLKVASATALKNSSVVSAIVVR